jgi:hypothetical protein
VVVVAVVGEIQALVGMAVAAGAVVQMFLAGQEITHLEAHLKEITEGQDQQESHHLPMA